LREQSYGEHDKPQDYLESFQDFIHNQLNQSAALSVVVTRPKDLTRENLREVRVLLDKNGFSEATLKAAWRDQTNQEIAASIIGFIRQAAIGEALLSFEQRVANAMQRIYSLQRWTTVQRRWLDRLAKQLVHEVVIDTKLVNEAFRDDGGIRDLDQHLGGNLNQVLETLNDHLWSVAS
jgi:type I restriction enzyme R subunit